MNVFYRLRCALARLMYGRNGADALGAALLALSFVFRLAAALVRVRFARGALQALSVALLLVLFYRVFSSDLPRRRAENAKFLYWFGPRRAALRDWRYRRADKAHKYVKCVCGVWCRVPRNVGKVELKCPKCGEKKIVKT